MPTLTTLRRLEFDEAVEQVDAGAAFVDLRNIDSYLDVHIPGSFALLYEFGPGMAARARDCLPLEMPLVLLHEGGVNMQHAAASLRGKGFAVLGQVRDAINSWAGVKGSPASTDVVRSPNAPAGVLLDVGDPGAKRVEGAVSLPVERLLERVDEVEGGSPLVIAAGFGVRAALAVGILERAGRRDIVFWRSR